MRLESTTDGREHPSTLTPDDHHPRPVAVSISNTSQVIAAGGAFDLDIPLGNAGFQWARVQIMGPTAVSPPASWREAASVHVTRDAAEAIGHSFRAAGSIYKSYSATYSKQNSDTNLSHKIFDSSAPNRYIALKDAILTGSNLRLTFHNYDGSSQTLWVKGQAQAY